MAQELTLRVITPDRIVLDTTASAVQIPGVDGSIGVLPRHAPMVAALGVGTLTYAKGAGGREGMFVAGGFAEVRDNTVRVVSPASEPPGQIDVERAKAAAQRARERLQASPDAPIGRGTLDQVRAEAALQRALMRLYVRERFTN
jgi:F-type H+-transporting ATPase subunit epsilon